MPLYTPFGSTEGTITEGNDNRLSTAQVINVKKNPKLLLILVNRKPPIINSNPI